MLGNPRRAAMARAKVPAMRASAVAPMAVCVIDESSPMLAYQSQVLLSWTCVL